mmetsp:Transcript_31188/g.72696  ORF Transcript_31188/g.72696 Transcript_31188/m.72696 type:complete len:230 (-) Transcript_31188:1639-2328(-)
MACTCQGKSHMHAGQTCQRDTHIRSGWWSAKSQSSSPRSDPRRRHRRPDPFLHCKSPAGTCRTRLQRTRSGTSPCCTSRSSFALASVGTFQLHTLDSENCLPDLRRSPCHRAHNGTGRCFLARCLDCNPCIDQSAACHSARRSPVGTADTLTFQALQWPGRLDRRGRFPPSATAEPPMFLLQRRGRSVRQGRPHSVGLCCTRQVCSHSRTTNCRKALGPPGRKQRRTAG